jgi:LysM repeat protein
MGGSPMLSVGQLGWRCVFLLALTIEVAGCSSEAARFNGDRYSRSNPEVTGSIQHVPIDNRPLPPQPVQQASVASNTSPPRPVVAVPSSAASGKSVVHVVKRGDTLKKISLLYHAPIADIAKTNNIQLTTRLKVGDHLVIPSVTVNSKPFPPLSNHSATSAQSTSAQAEPKNAVKATEEAAALPMFRWPVRGHIIAGFSSSLNGARNDGINLAVPEGTPVKAAEDGVVSYAGNELKGEGNLVLIRHSHGYSTV